jgi:hypothetical protein
MTGNKKNWQFEKLIQIDIIETGTIEKKLRRPEKMLPP